MKYLILLFILTFSFKSRSQDLLRRLQLQMWYVKGDIYKRDTCSIHLDKPENCTGYLIFGKDELEMHMLPTDNQFICHCEILADKMKLSYEIKYLKETKTDQVEIFYKMVSNGRDFDLLPISSADFK